MIPALAWVGEIVAITVDSPRRITNLAHLKTIAPVLSVDVTGPPGDINSLAWVPMLRELGRVLSAPSPAGGHLESRRQEV